MAEVTAIAAVEALYARMDKHVREIVASMLPPVIVPVQDDGSVVSNTHRILNFQGSGVQVTDNPSSRRTDIFIPGSSVGNVTTKVSSSTATKRLSLWNGSSNDSPPANWQTVAFDDSAWSAAVVASTNVGQEGFIPSGASAIWSSATPAVSAVPGEKVLFRHTFTVPSGTIVSATLTGAFDAWGDLYVNGSLAGGENTQSASGPQLVLPVEAYLLPGTTNVIAAYGNDDGGGGVNKAWAVFQLAYSQNNVVTTLENTLAADVTMTTVNTFYDGPTVTLGAGTWFLSGAVACSNGSFATEFTAKLWDGTTVLRSGENNARAASISVSIALTGVVTVSSSTTYKISAAANNASSLIKAAVLQNASGNTASYLNAIPV